MGPYSQAIVCGNLVFCSGQIAIDPKTNQFTNGTIEQQTKQVLENLKNVLIASGSSLEEALKVEVFLIDMADYKTVNEIYSNYFVNKPARQAVAVKELPLGARIEISCIARCKNV